MNQPKESNGGSWWKTASAVGAAVLVLIFGKAIGIGLGRVTANQISFGYSEAREDAALEAGLAKAASLVREQAPIKVDQSTTLVGAMSTGREIIYSYTLSFDIPTDRLHEAEAELQTQNQSRVCGDERTRKLISMGGAMSAAYTDESGDLLKTRVTSCA